MTIDELLEEARSHLTKRLTPKEAFEEMQNGARLIDIRSLEQRMRDGVIPGAIQIDRNEMEWRCDPSSSQWKSEAIAPDDYTQRLIILCNQGCQSSLAAYNLCKLGLTNVTGVIGGFEEWKASGLPLEAYKKE